MSKFLKILLIIHVSSSFWFGCIGLVIAEDNRLEGFLKGMTVMPLIFGNFIYIGCLLFSTIGIYFFNKSNNYD